MPNNYLRVKHILFLGGKKMKRKNKKRKMKTLRRTGKLSSYMYRVAN